MIDENKISDGDDGMRSSADALSKKLYSTVMDVFGNYAVNDEEEYNNMVETLRNKQMQKKNGFPKTPVKYEGATGIIEKRLLEGYTLSEGLCDKCVTPLMAYKGRTSCVVCEKDGEVPKDLCHETNETQSDVELELTSTTESDATEKKKEALINKELSQVNDRRSQATNVYTSKILIGYTMHDRLCSKCDMPMLKYQGLVECAFCQIDANELSPKPAKEEVKDEVNIETVAEEHEDDVNKMPRANNDISNNPAGPPKTVKEAEMIVDRLRSQQKSNGCRAKIESESEKDLLYGIIESIVVRGNQGGGEISASLQDYFSEKKQERDVGMRIKEEASAAAALGARAAALELGGLQVGTDPATGTDAKEDEKNDSNGDGAFELQPPTGCGAGNSFFSSFF